MKNFYEQFKTPIVTVFIIFISLFLYTTIAGPIPFSINSVQTTKTDLFTADGKGEVSAVPDEATIYLGITSNAKTVTEAQNSANALSQKTITAMKSQGISDKDIKTTNYSVTPNYGKGTIEPMMIEMPIRNNENTITGYTVSQSLEVKVKPIEKVNKVIDSATASGANMVGGISFTFSEDLQKSLENKARDQAIKEAKNKAQSLAGAAGIRLGKVVNVIENSSYPRMAPMAAGLLKAEDSTVSNQTNVTPGENSVTVNITIYYETH